MMQDPDLKTHVEELQKITNEYKKTEEYRIIKNTLIKVSIIQFLSGFLLGIAMTITILKFPW